MLTPEIFLHNLKTTDIRKSERYDNPILAEWNRMQPCAICGAAPPSDNSHTLKKKRTGNSGSQVYAIPLCRDCHVEYESISIEKYLELHPNLFEIVTRHIEKWAEYFTRGILEVKMEGYVPLNPVASLEKPEPRKAKVPSRKKSPSVFKKVKNSRIEKCKLCFFKSLSEDEVRHHAGCSVNQ